MMNGIYFDKLWVLGFINEEVVGFFFFFVVLEIKKINVFWIIDVFY